MRLRHFVGVLGTLLLWASAAGAEPYLAVREGMRCSACHVNMNGGGMRSDLVTMHARDVLHYPSFLGTFSNPPDFFSGEINKYLALGGDLRASNTAIFQDRGNPAKCPGPTTSGVCVDNDTVFRGRLEENDLDVTEATLYGQVRLIPDYVTLYIDQRFQPTTDTREVFGLLRGVLPWNGYIKAGRMYLPYGLQLQDDGAFIRGGTNGSANTGFSFRLQEAGGALGFEPEPLTFILAMTDGAAGDRDVRVTATTYAVLTDLPVVRNVLVGGSFSRVGPPGSEALRFGFFSGTTIERFTVLGEADFLSDRTPDTNGRTIGRFVAYGEGNYLLFDWLNVKVALDFSDDDGSLPRTADDSENRFSFGFEPFLSRFVQPRIFYRVNSGVQAQPAHNQNVLLVEMHLFF
jgi:hypothetical protein